MFSLHLKPRRLVRVSNPNESPVIIIIIIIIIILIIPLLYTMFIHFQF